MAGRSEQMHRIAISWLVFLIVFAIGVPLLPLPDPIAVDLTAALASPSASHLAGTDELGRDVFSRLLHAAQSTLMIVTGATFGALVIATSLGGLAGYLGGWLDRAIRVSVDLLWSVPFVVFVV